MKKQSILSALALIICVTSVAQTDSLANLFYRNVQATNSVLRFEDYALASIRFDNGRISDNLLYYLKDESGAIISAKQTRNNWNEVVFENLELDVDYSINTSFQGQEYIVSSFHTRDHSLEPFEASENLFNALEDWYELPQATGPEAGKYLINYPTIPFFESIAYLQALYDMPHLPNSLLEENSVANIFDTWIDYGDPNDSTSNPPEIGDEIYDAILDYVPLDHNTLDKCICQYTLRTRPITSPQHTLSGNNYNYSRSTTKSHLEISSLNSNHHANSFKKVDVGTAGPISSVDVFIRSEGRNSTRTVESGGLTSDPSTSANEHLAGFELYFFCDGLPQSIRSRLLLIHSANEETQDSDFLEPTPAEECLCEKEVQICWRYDAEIQAKTEKTINCGVLVPVRDRAVTVDNFVEVTLQQGSSAKETLKAGKYDVQIACNRDPIEVATKTVDVLAKNAKILELQIKILDETDPVKIAELNTALIQEHQRLLIALDTLTSSGTTNCRTVSPIPVSFDDCKMITLKSNEITKFEMASAYKIIAKIGDCVNASASIKSDFYMTAIMGQPNNTPIDVSYCCAKKWGTYVSGSYPGSPISKPLIRTEVANKFNLFGAWDAPYHYLSTNPIMVHDWDNLYGTRFCNDVIFDNTTVKPKDQNLYDEASVSKLSPSSLQISGLSNKDETTEIMINDISGKIIFSGITNQEQFTTQNLSLRNGIYIIILKTGNQLKTIKYINYE